MNHSVSTLTNRAGRAQRVASALLVALLIILGPLPAAVSAQEPPPVYTFEECETIEANRLRDELNGIAQYVFAAEQSSLDIGAIVERKWIELGMDATLDAAVDAAVERVRGEEDYWNRLLSGWSSAKAEELTTKVANYAFGSEAFRAGVDALAIAVADELAESIGVMTTRSASSALLCVQEFIGDTYAATMAEVFENQIQAQLAQADLDSETDADFGLILESRTRTVAGLGIIIGTQIAKRLAQQVAKRIAGKVAGRVLGKAATSIIPLAGWIIGAGLIVWDLIEAGEGSLPQIRESLKESSVRESIRTQIIEAVEAELQAELPEMARAVSNDIFSEWQDFRGSYSRVLELAEEHEQFQEILESATVDDVGKISDLVATAEQTLSEEELVSAIDSGHFERILNLPSTAFAILAATGDPQTVVAWADLAGESIVRVVELDLFRIAEPSDFADGSALETILNLNDREVVQRLMLLNPLERDVLLSLPTERVISVTTNLETEDLRWLVSYIAELSPSQSNRLVERIVREPALMQHLRFEDIRRAVVQSDNIDETLAFLAPEEAGENSPVRQVTEVISDTERVINGEVTLLLFWRKYGTWQNGLILAGLLIVLFLAVRLLFRRERPVNVTVNLPDRDRER